MPLSLYHQLYLCHQQEIVLLSYLIALQNIVFEDKIFINEELSYKKVICQTEALIVESSILRCFNYPHQSTIDFYLTSYWRQ